MHFEGGSGGCDCTLGTGIFMCMETGDGLM
jgi:hypothetical protein